MRACVPDSNPAFSNGDFCAISLSCPPSRSRPQSRLLSLCCGQLGSPQLHEHTSLIVGGRRQCLFRLLLSACPPRGLDRTFKANVARLEEIMPARACVQPTVMRADARMSPLMVMFMEVSPSEPVARVLFVIATFLLSRKAGKGREKVHEAKRQLE